MCTSTDDGKYLAMLTSRCSATMESSTRSLTKSANMSVCSLTKSSTPSSASSSQPSFKDFLPQIMLSVILNASCNASSATSLSCPHSFSYTHLQTSTRCRGDTTEYMVSCMVSKACLELRLLESKDDVLVATVVCLE